MKSNSANWRAILPVHPAAELLPRMTKEELLELGSDIKANGLINAIVLCSELIDPAAVHKGCKYSVLDGISRLDAMDAVSIKFKIILGKLAHPTIDIENHFDRSIPEPVIIYGEVDPYAFVLSVNLHRRHLTAEQKRDLIAKVLTAQPEKSNRIIAKQADVDDKTVGSVRRELEQRAEIPRVSAVEDTKGRKQPAHRPAKRSEDHFAEKRARTAATKDDDRPQKIDADHLISRFAAQVRSRGLEIARQIGANWPMLIERSHEVVDEIALEAERWSSEAHRPELPDIPAFLRRSAP